MTVNQHTPSGAQRSTSARAKNHATKPARPKHKAASDKKGKAEGNSKKGARLSDPATVERIFKLQRDEPFDSGDYLCVGDLVNDLLQYADADAFSPELSKVLARLDAGETLEEIERKERERYERAQERQWAAKEAQGEPKDKTSFDWRLWKQRHLKAAFEGDDAEAFHAAQLELAELLGEMVARLKPGHVGAAVSILPMLVADRQQAQKRGEGR
jgi:hypothetical protein